MLTSNVIRRTFLIRYGKSIGTAFAADWQSRQYLVTARHVTAGISSGEHIDIFHANLWKTVAVNVVGVGVGEIDVTVLAVSIKLAPPYPLKMDAGGIGYGQTVYFVGFPFGWTSSGNEINQDFPIPFAKSGILMAIDGRSMSTLYLDAHGNRGFSGGPVVFVPGGRKNGEYQVAGVVSCYPTPLLDPIVDAQGEPILNQGEPIAYFKENPGIVVAFMIKHATDLIDSNPIGYLLTVDDD